MVRNGSARFPRSEIGMCVSSFEVSLLETHSLVCACSGFGWFSSFGTHLVGEKTSHRRLDESVHWALSRYRLVSHGIC